MKDGKYVLHDGKKGAALAVRVIPRANENRIVDILDDGAVQINLSTDLKVEKTNEVLREFLAEIFGVPASKIEVVAGRDGKDKLVSILDINADMTQKLIMKFISGKDS